MGKAERNRQQSARQRIAMQQAAARQAEARRRLFIAGGSVLLVIVIVVGLIVVKSLKTSTAARSTPAIANATLVREITTVPASVLDNVGGGPTGASAVSPLKPITGAGLLTTGGKPEVLYEGAEYCPYCAAERWAMVVALSRFGTFSGLKFIRSSSTDYYSSTPTLTFYGSSYTSKYITFVPKELFTVTDKALEKASTSESALCAKYGGSNGSCSFPFVDIANRYVISGAQYLPSILGAGYQPGNPSHLTWAQVAADVRNPSSPIGQQIMAAANHITAAICKVTKGQPGNICHSAAVTAIGGNV
jgi:hypothetical protein